jgi:hypothetical protein
MSCYFPKQLLLMLQFEGCIKQALKNRFLLHVVVLLLPKVDIIESLTRQLSYPTIEKLSVDLDSRLLACCSTRVRNMQA